MGLGFFMCREKNRCAKVLSCLTLQSRITTFYKLFRHFDVEDLWAADLQQQMGFTGAGPHQAGLGRAQDKDFLFPVQSLCEVCPLEHCNSHLHVLLM